MNYGARAKNIITDRDIKQKTVAAALGITEGKISCYLNGKNEMPTHVVAGIARYLNVSTDYLLGLTDQPERPMELSEGERKLIAAFRTLSADQREIILENIRLMQRQNQR